MGTPGWWAENALKQAVLLTQDDLERLDVVGDDDRPASLPCAMPPTFMRLGLCTQPKYRRIDFFNEKSGVPQTVCAECNVRDGCLQWAIATDQRFGVWGGLTTPQRRARVRSKQNA